MIKSRILTTAFSGHCSVAELLSLACKDDVRCRIQYIWASGSLVSFICILSTVIMVVMACCPWQRASQDATTLYDTKVQVVIITKKCVVNCKT